MQIHCPKCKHKIVIKGLKAGGYQPKCPGCEDKFMMVVAVIEGHRLVLAGTSLSDLKVVRVPPAFKAAAQANEATFVPGASAVGATYAPPQVESSYQDKTMPSDPRQDVTDPASEQTYAPPHRRDEVTPVSETVGQAPRQASSPGLLDGAGLSGRLDGYEIEKPLGQGGMGTVYLAKQVSLDRPVAVKTINAEFANNPVFLSRFTREAYAAAQLTHHNVVQIYDIGEDQNTNYFSMEFVQGQSLDEVLQSQGALDVEEAAGYILQAARGLKFAHDHEMIHRDVKPANLMVNDQSVVKVADLGLVKTAKGEDGSTPVNPIHDGPSGQTAHTAMGTPAYMAPEQGENAALVDARADIYSLGCTFYVLTTGRPIFEGKTAAEVMTKHASAEVIPPEQIAKRVPGSVSSIILRMVAKNPDDRYQSMDEVIRAIEEFLGITAGPFTPRKEHADTLERAVTTFNTAKFARLRGWLLLAFTLLCIGGAALGALSGRPAVLVGFGVLWFTTGFCYTIITGITRRAFVFRKMRQLVFGASIRDWFSWALFLVIGVAAAAFFGLLPPLIGAAIGGTVLALAFYFTIDMMANRERKPAIESVRGMLKQMRLRGLEEDAVRRFICKYSGKRWEPFYEALFDYEAKIEARQNWGSGDNGKPRKKYGAWRDGFIAWVDAKQEKREQARQRKHLAKIEVKRLKQEGKSEAEAESEAKKAAGTMVGKAASYKQTGEWVDPAKESSEEVDTDLVHDGLVTRLLNLVMGGRARFLAGLALLGVYAVWVRQNKLLEDVQANPGIGTMRGLLEQDTPPLKIPGVPANIMEILCHHGTGLAGIFLIVSALYHGKKMTLFMLPGAALLIAAPLLPIPDLPMTNPAEAGLAVGSVVCLLGLWLGRRSKTR